VLKSWEGLGYYARARNLHRAALVVRDRMGGELPGRSAQLRELPGFGEYTAGAVASIAFGEAVPAVDGNVRRVLARMFDEPAPSARWLRERAAALVDPARPGDFNQALMELGATVCRPRAPECARCPLEGQCAARANGTVAERPRARARKPVPDVEIAVAALVRRRTSGAADLLLVRRPPEGLLGGLWELPSAEVRGAAAVEVARRAAAVAGASPRGEPTPLGSVTQVYSHFRGVYRPFLWDVGGCGRSHGGAWVDRRGLEELALSRAQRKLTRAVLAPETVVLGAPPP
jgi:A/G-specific adenine glycosylase